MGCGGGKRPTRGAPYAPTTSAAKAREGTCFLPDFFHCDLAYEAGMPEDQLFGFRGGGVCVCVGGDDVRRDMDKQ